MSGAEHGSTGGSEEVVYPLWKVAAGDDAKGVGLADVVPRVEGKIVEVSLLPFSLPRWGIT